MIELRWLAKPHTTTEAPRLQFRLHVDVDASGAFCPGPCTEWTDVPHVVEPSPPRPVVDRDAERQRLSADPRYAGWVAAAPDSEAP